MKKELFAITQSNAYITEEFLKKTGNTKTAFFNECIHTHFQPKLEKFRVEYEQLLYFYENKDFIGEIDHLTQYDLKQVMGRIIDYCRRNPISNCEPFKSILYHHYFTDIQDINWKTKSNESILQDTEAACSMIQKQMRYYGKDNPIAILLEIFTNWDIFWYDERSYNLFIDIIYYWDIVEPISLYDAVIFLYKVDQILCKQLFFEKL